MSAVCRIRSSRPTSSSLNLRTRSSRMSRAYTSSKITPPSTKSGYWRSIRTSPWFPDSSRNITFFRLFNCCESFVSTISTRGDGLDAGAAGDEGAMERDQAEDRDERGRGGGELSQQEDDEEASSDEDERCQRALPLRRPGQHRPLRHHDQDHRGGRDERRHARGRGAQRREDRPGHDQRDGDDRGDDRIGDEQRQIAGRQELAQERLLLIDPEDHQQSTRRQDYQNGDPEEKGDGRDTVRHADRA